MTRGDDVGAVKANREGVQIFGPMEPSYEKVLSDEALGFLVDLSRKFEGERQRLMRLRAERQSVWDGGQLPDFLPETRSIREKDWKIRGVPADLLDRRVEITGPADRKMIVNALNSGASVFMADFEDALSPSWSNLIEGQVGLMDYWRSEIDFTDEQTGKRYEVDASPAVLIVRPRGWHLTEEHVLIDGAPVSGAIFDFALYFFHNAAKTITKGSGPYLYLPKIESHLEARLWNDIFVEAQKVLGFDVGTIKATVLIETLPAAFEMDEILYEMRDHIVGLNCGRWDYIFSYIKTLRLQPDYVLPDRAQVVMGDAFLRAYCLLLVRTCHKRGAFAMGGMAAQIPNRRDPQANDAAMAAVRADKEREGRDGHDGTWVAHPDLVQVAKDVFDHVMPKQNQLDRAGTDDPISASDLLRVHGGDRTEEGLRTNIRVGVQYIEAWLRGNGAVPLYNLMEDAATAEISRAQIWQWLHHGAALNDGRTMSSD
ncbi:MAG: malate synthase A, partial [Methyloligellaceae bacterium]